MSTRSHYKSVPWLLLAVLVFTPVAVLAQQDKAPQTQSAQNPAQSQSDAAQAKSESGQEQTEAAPPKDGDGKLISVQGGKALGMSILGNQEAPKALVIVPWKSSELGNAVGVSTMLDDSRLPVDKEVFMRVLSYYEIRSESVRPSAATTKTNATQPNAELRRKP